MATKKKKNKPAKKVLKKTEKKSVKKAKKNSIKKIAKKKPAKKSIKKPVKKSVKKAEASTSKASSKPQVDYSKAVTPLGDRLVVKLVDGERVTAGGLIIPDSASMASGYLKAKVLATGVGARNKKGHVKPLDVKVGDTILFSEYAGTKINFNSEDLQIINESDVMGIVE